MLKVTTVLVFMTSTRSPRVLAFNTGWGKVIDWRATNHLRKAINTLKKRSELEGLWFQDRLRITVKVNLYDHPVEEFVHYISVSCLM